MRKIFLAAALALTTTTVMGLCMKMDGRTICDVEHKSDRASLAPAKNSTNGKISKCQVQCNSKKSKCLEKTSSPFGYRSCYHLHDNCSKDCKKAEKNTPVVEDEDFFFVEDEGFQVEDSEEGFEEDFEEDEVMASPRKPAAPTNRTNSTNSTGGKLSKCQVKCNIKKTECL